MEGTGFLGQAAENVYHLETDDLYLVGTAEVPLAGLPHRARSSSSRPLPPPLRRLLAVLSAARPARYGKDTRGIFRVHWFDKVEMFVLRRPRRTPRPSTAGCSSCEKQFLDALELPYRVIDVATGDLGRQRGAQVRLRGVDPDAGALPRADLDLELHRVPGAPAAGSASAPRTGRCARWRRSTARWCAIPRTIVAILENHQQADGSVHVPAALAPYLGGRTVLEALS